MRTGLAAFFFKEEMFRIVLTPKQVDFSTYRLLDSINSLLFPQASIPETFSVKLINTGLAGQFLVHMRTSMYVGVLCASPYILYLLFRFVSLALYPKEVCTAYGRSRFFDVHVGCRFKLLSYIFADIPFPRYISSKYKPMERSLFKISLN